MTRRPANHEGPAPSRRVTIEAAIIPTVNSPDINALCERCDSLSLACLVSCSTSLLKGIRHPIRWWYEFLKSRTRLRKSLLSRHKSHAKDTQACNGSFYSTRNSMIIISVPGSTTGGTPTRSA